MSNQVPMRRRAPRGFTLIEIMIVVGIIIILAGIGLAVGLQVKRSSTDQVTKTALKTLDEAMGVFLKDHPEPNGASWFPALWSFPDSKRALQGLKLHYAPPPGKLTDPPIADGVLDGYGNMIKYQSSSPPAKPTGFFLSYGPDGVAGGNDDIFSQGASAQ